MESAPESCTGARITSGSLGDEGILLEGTGFGPASLRWAFFWEMFGLGSCRIPLRAYR